MAAQSRSRVNSSPARLGLAVIFALLLAGCGADREPDAQSGSRLPAVEATAPLWVSSRLPGSIGGARFSPEASRLVAVVGEAPRGGRPQSEGTKLRLWLVDSSGVPSALTDGPADAGPSWHPDGRRIAFLRLPPPRRVVEAREVTDDAGAWLALMATSVGVVTLDAGVTALPVAQGVWQIAAWSPDGRSLVCEGAMVQAGVVRPGVVLLREDESVLRTYVLPSEIDHVLSLAWSPDSMSVALDTVTRHRKRLGRGVYVLQLEGGMTELVYAADQYRGDEVLGYVTGTGEVCFIEAVPESQGTRIQLNGLDVRSGDHRDVASVVVPAGAVLGTMAVSGDGEGVAVAVSAAEAGPDVVVWSYGGESGRLAVPSGSCGADVLDWNARQHSLAVAYQEGEGSFVAVYELPPQE